MVILPEEFEATKYPGYFWNTINKKLYSCKVDGVLKPLKLHKAETWFQLNPKTFPGDWYVVSVRGKRKIMTVIELEKIKQTGERARFPVRE